MDIDEILKLVPVGDIAKKFNVSEDVARQAVAEGGATLLGGLARNAQSESGSAAIEKALGKHAGFKGATSVNDIDENDGEKIVSHVFGDNKKKITKALSEEPKAAGIDFGKLLPMLAPIIMGILANQKGSQQSQGGGIGDLIGGLIGGGQNNSGGGLGGVLGGLGGLLGGGQNNNATQGGGGGLDIGGLLGGILGGNK
ncbi:DUF937 domain-containing protein [Microbacterium sp. YY-01]|uniref:DUF937 domain-containing protein n=1 Tax=Microbacterium sp. YY-01 TaxID=3421634 RepID=UPI003D17AAD5